MPIRIRLTLWYIALLGIILIIFSVLFYWVLKYSLHAQIDSTLTDRAQQIGASIEAQQVFVSNTGSIYLPQLELLLNVFASPAIFIQIIDPLGEVIMTTRTLGSQHFPPIERVIKTIQQGKATHTTITFDDSTVRIYTAPLLVENRVVGAVQVGQSIQFIEDTLNPVILFLSGGTLLAVILAAFGGAILARQALQPIEQINQAAMQIVGGRDLKQRLQTSNTNDEINRLTVTINEMLERLDNFFQAQVRLSADVSHELRTPLTAIRGNVDLLRRGAADDPQELNETISIIDSELDRMARIVADLLLLSQADAGLSLRMELVELDTIILEVYRQVQVMANGVNIHLGHEDQAIVRGDGDRIKQLLLNLVTNAIKHTPSEGIVSISLFNDPDWVRVVVQDTGRGIAATALPHIFERFYRGENNDRKGLGLGLSIAQWIANAHGGKITVTSEPDHGSEFTLWLPTKENALADTRPSASKFRMN